MRTARQVKFMDSSDSGRGDSAAVKELSASSATTVAEPPSWTTRAKPKGIARVPTHAVRPAEERRAYARAKLSLPLRVKRVAGQRERTPQSLRTTNISSSGVLFLSPKRIEPGTPIELEVCLVDRPFGRGTVKMTTEAHIVRAEPAARTGWHALAACFDDITFQREEPIPSRFQRQ
jgi:PilZ domain